MSFSDLKKLLLFQANPTGVASSVPTNLNVMPCRTLTFSDKVNSVERTVVKPHFGNNPKAVTGFYGEVTLETELVGGQENGVSKAGAKPFYEDLLLCAGYVVTTTAFNVSAEIQNATKTLITLADEVASRVNGTYDGWTLVLSLSEGVARNQNPVGSQVSLADTKQLIETKTQVSTATNITLSDSASSVDDYYNGDTLVIAGERRVIQDYVGSTRTATVAALSAIPEESTLYSIIHTTVVRTGFTLQANSSQTVVFLDANASTVSNFYNGNRLVVKGREVIITAYNGSTKAARIAPYLTDAPAAGTAYRITNDSIVSLLKCETGSATTAINLNQNSSAKDNFYCGMLLTIGSEQRTIVAYDSSTKIATVSASFATAPTSTSYYRIDAIAEVERANVLGAGSTNSEIQLDTAASGESQRYLNMRLSCNNETSVITDYNATTKIATVSPAFNTQNATGKPYIIYLDNDSYNGLPITVRHFSDLVIKNTGNQQTTASKIYLPDLVVGNVELWGLDLSVTHAGVTERRRIVSPSNKIADYVTVSPAFSFTPDNNDYFEISEAAEITAFDGISKIATLNKNLRVYSKSNSTYSIGIERTIRAYNGETKQASITPPLPVIPAINSLYTTVANRTYTLKTPSRTSPLRTGTAYFFQDDTLYSITNALVNVSIELSAANIPVLKATLTGLIDKQENATNPPLNRSDFVDAYPVNAANTNTIYLNGYEKAVLDKFSVDTGNKIEYRNMPNFEGIVLLDRMPKGSFNIEAADIETVNWSKTITNEDKGAVIISHGVTHNRVTVVVPQAQFENKSNGSSQNIVMNSIDFIPLPQIGNDELKIVLA
jgi:hypothetical protein